MLQNSAQIVDKARGRNLSIGVTYRADGGRYIYAENE
jgi:hypothetical protein